MPPTAKPSTAKPVRADLSLAPQPEPSQLDNIKAQLDLVLLALEALAGVGSEEILQAAAQQPQQQLRRIPKKKQKARRRQRQQSRKN